MALSVKPGGQWIGRTIVLAAVFAVRPVNKPGRTVKHWRCKARASALGATANTRPVDGRWQSGGGLGRPKQGVQKWWGPQCVGQADYRRTRNWQHMQCGVLPQANRMCARVCMLVHQCGVVVIQMQSLVVVVVVTIALVMDRHVVQLGRPMGRYPGRKKRCRLPDNNQHQQKCANRARHARCLTSPFCSSRGLTIDTCRNGMSLGTVTSRTAITLRSAVFRCAKYPPRGRWCGCAGAGSIRAGRGAGAPTAVLTRRCRRATDASARA